MRRWWISHARATAINLAGNPLLLAQVDGNESAVEMFHGHPAEALPILERTGRTFERFGMINEFATALVNQIGANLLLLQPLPALKASDEARALLHRITDPQIRATLRNVRAGARAANGRLSEARILLDELIHSAESGADEVQRALARAGQARLDLASGHAATALILGKQAISALPAPEYDRPRANAWLGIVRALHAMDRSDEAAGEVAAFGTWARGSGTPLVVLYSALAEAEQAVAMNRHAAAMLAYQRAMDLAIQHGIADILNKVGDSEARFLLAVGDLQQAIATIGKIAHFADRDFNSALLEAWLYHALGQQGAWNQAMVRVRRLAGERAIPDRLSTPLGSTSPIAGTR
jgi:tetratricopeptide (TPR) repeat protein